MTFTDDKRWLLAIYRSGSATETAAVVRDALTDICEANVRAVAMSVLGKLNSMSEVAFCKIFAESVACYE